MVFLVESLRSDGECARFADPYLMDLHGFTVEKVCGPIGFVEKAASVTHLFLSQRGPSSHPKPRTSLIPLFGLAKTSVKWVHGVPSIWIE